MDAEIPVTSQRCGSQGMQKSKVKAEATAGFSLLEMMIVVAVVAILASTTFLSVVRAREQTQKQNIVNNLKKIEAAKSQWAMENGKSTGATPTKTDLAPYFDKNVFPTGVSNVRKIPHAC